MTLEETTKQWNAENARRLMARGEDELDLGLGEDAAKSFAEAADLVPTMASYALRAAQIFLEVGEIESSVYYAENAVVASPRRKEIRLVAAAALQAQGRSGEARDHLKEVASLDAEDDRVKDLMNQSDGESGGRR